MRKLFREVEGLDRIVCAIELSKISEGFAPGKCRDEWFKMAAEAICQDYEDVTVADIRYFASKAIQGVYGDIYGYFDVLTLLKHFRAFYGLRMDLTARLREEAHHNRKFELKDLDMKKVYANTKHTTKKRESSDLKINNINFE